MGTILKLDDIQGNILRGYRSLHQARFMFFHTRSAVSGRRYIDALLPVVTTAKIGGEPGAATNIAFTFAGLRALGLPTSTLVSFPSAFQDGMKARAPLLGDSDESAPERWDAPWRSEPVHVMLMVYAASRMELEQSCRKVVQLAPDGVEELRPHQDAEAIFADGGGSLRIEHFGFAEVLSNPDLDNPPTEARQCPVGNSDGLAVRFDRSRWVNSSWVIRMREASSAACRCRTRFPATARTWSCASSISTWRDFVRSSSCKRRVSDVSYRARIRHIWQQK